MNESDQQTTRKRHWFRYSLRTFFALVLILGIWLGWLANRVRNQKQAVHWVEANNGLVQYDFEVRSPSHARHLSNVLLGFFNYSLAPNYCSRVVEVDFFMSQDLDDIARLSSLRRIERLTICGSQIDDLSPLKKLHHLRFLCISHSPVWDLGPISRLQYLEVLQLQNTPVSDLSPIIGNASLKELDISNTRVNDLSPLMELPNLEELRLCDQVEDLTVLTQLHGLQRLYISCWRIDLQQDSKIRAALPNCQIVWHQKTPSIRDLNQ